MDSAPRLEVVTTTELRASLLSFLSLLPLGAVALDHHVAAAVSSNPVLEREPGGFCPRCGQYAVAGRCRACLSMPGLAPADAPDPPDWRAELAAAARLEAPTSLVQAVDDVVAALDDRGFLTEVPSLPEATVDAVVTLLREVGPPGVGARSAVECVLVQVRALAESGDLPAFAPLLFSDHLTAVSSGQIPQVAESLGVSTAAVLAALDAVRARTTPYVPLPSAGPTPPTDVVFRADPSDPARVTAVVVGAAHLGLTVVRDLGDGSAEANAWLRPHLREAERLLDALTARATMLERVAEVLADEQAVWVLKGTDHRPLRRADVARRLGVHPSTVGRTVGDKTARLPDGRTLPLTRFFGADQSHLDLVAAVVRAHPRATDAELAAHLAAAGTPLARRTVAKYRARLLGVPKPASPPG